MPRHLKKTREIKLKKIRVRGKTQLGIFISKNQECPEGFREDQVVNKRAPDESNRICVLRNKFRAKKRPKLSPVRGFRGGIREKKDLPLSRRKAGIPRKLRLSGGPLFHDEIRRLKQIQDKLRKLDPLSEQAERARQATMRILDRARARRNSTRLPSI